MYNNKQKNESKLEKYLRKIGFITCKYEYKACHGVDIFIVFLYYIISAGTIIHDFGSIIVLILNILCLVRAVLRNSMESARTTRRIKADRNVKNEYIEKYHYFHKALVEIVIFAYALLLLIYLNFSFEEFLTKLSAIVVIIITCLDDIETIIIDMLGAYINIKKKISIHK